MTQEALDDHMRQYHKADEPKPTLAQAHAMIEQLYAAHLLCAAHEGPSRIKILTKGLSAISASIRNCQVPGMGEEA